MAYYNFTFTNTQDASLSANTQVWIWFPYEYYDYYVGDSSIYYAGKKDLDDFEIYYIPCHVQIENSNSYVGNSECTTKRHSVRVKLGATVASQQDVSITIVGIRNPNADSLEFTIAVMDVYNPVDADDVYWGRRHMESSVVYYTYTTNTFATEVTAHLDIVRVETDKEESRALRDKNDYEFTFQVWNNQQFVWY